MESHVRFFETVGGVFHQMVYDNMRVAVSRFVGTHEKEPTAALLQLRGHYGFTHRFCNAYRGNEKGHVERSVEYVRRKAFGLKDHFADPLEAEEWLSKALDKLNAQKQSGTEKSAIEMLGAEQIQLFSLPSSRPVCAEQVQLRVDKYATVSFRTNRYSVPDHDVSVLSNELRVYHQNSKVAVHKRSFEKHHRVIEIEHYLSTFKRKPGALAGSVALAGSCYLKNLYRQYFHGEARNFIDLLVYCRENKVSEEKLEETVRRLIAPGSGELTTEKLRAILGNEETPVKEPVEDKIYRAAKQQLSELTALMH